MSYIFTPARITSIPIHGVDARFPVHRVFCVGQNYSLHAQEMGASGREDPFFFMKPASSVVPVTAGTVSTVPYPGDTQSLHHEVELVVAIGQRGANIGPEQAMDFVYGYAVGIDLTRRDLQSVLKSQGRPWEIAKGFEASAPVGSISPKTRTGQLAQGNICLAVDGIMRQTGNLDQMIWSVEGIIHHLSRHWTLTPGDLVFTGTPAGVGAVARGNHLLATIDGLDALQIQLV
ncbi:MAG: fumarylacetoacetate hydrolase family protein [Lautropia sp.]|nr:fumarylacetoacetate hydrolase family protein [Lautropia sp.]